MNRHAPTGRGEGCQTSMTNTETNDSTATVAEQGANVTPAKTRSKKSASQKKRLPKARKPANNEKPKASAPDKKAMVGRRNAKAAGANREASAQRAASKSAKIMELIGRAKGAALAEIIKATDWQAHSVRGFLSTAAKKHNIKIDSVKNEVGERVYKIAR